MSLGDRMFDFLKKKKDKNPDLKLVEEPAAAEEILEMVKLAEG